LSLALNGKRGQHYWWIAPVYSMAQIAYGRLCNWLRDTDRHQEGWTARDGTRSIELNGATIWFKSAEKPDNLYGEDVHGAVIDEATRCREESWHALRSTLTATQGPVWIIGNVKGRKNWAYRLARKAEAGEPDMLYVKITWQDAVEAGIIKAQEIEDARRALPEHVFRELYEAEAAEDSTNPFGLSAIESCTMDGLADGPAVAFGVDLAKSVDWTVVIGLNADGAECVEERWQSDWGATEERILRLVGDTKTLVDSTGVGDPIVERLHRKKRNVTGLKFSATSKQQMMERMAVATQNQEWRFRRGVLASEMEQFEFVYSAGGVKYNAPQGLHDDCVCAAALAIQQWDKVAHTVAPSIMWA